MIPVSLQVIGGQELTRGWDRLGAELRDWRGVWSRVQSWWYGIINKQFQSEGSYIPRTGSNPIDSNFNYLDPKTKWRELTPKYKKWKDRHYPGKSILQMKGNLRSAATGGSNSFVTTTKTSIKLGTTGLDYARIHMLGGKAGFGHNATLPPRPYAVVPPRGSAQFRELDQIIAAYLRKIVRL